MDNKDQLLEIYRIQIETLSEGRETDNKLYNQLVDLIDKSAALLAVAAFQEEPDKSKSIEKVRFALEEIIEIHHKNFGGHRKI